MDKLFIHDLKIETIIGCLAWERKVKQFVILDLEITYDAKLATLSDDLTDTLDYSSIANSITEFVATSTFKLIETLAEQTAAFVKEKYNLKQISLKLTKPAAIANAKSVGIVINRN